jgi:hypothetical protein
MGSNRAYLIPARLLNLARVILPPLVVSSHKTRSRGDCEGPIRSVISAQFSLSQSSISIFSRTKGKAIQGNNFYSPSFTPRVSFLCFHFQNCHQPFILTSSSPCFEEDLAEVEKDKGSEGANSQLRQINRIPQEKLNKLNFLAAVVPHHGLISWVMWYYSCNGLLISGLIAIGPAVPSTFFINIFILYPIDPEDLINNSYVPASISSGSSNPHAPE